MKIYKIKLTEGMAKQVIDDNKTFTTENEAYIHGIARYGSASENQLCGWSIEEV